MDNEGYHDPVDREYYLSPSGEDIPEKLKQESSFSKSQEDLKKGQNGTAGFRPKNSRFDSGKFSGSQIYCKFPFVNPSICHWFKLYFICIIYGKYTKQHRIRLQYNRYTNGIQKKSLWPLHGHGSSPWQGIQVQRGQYIIEV